MARKTFNPGASPSPPVSAPASPEPAPPPSRRRERRRERTQGTRMLPLISLNYEPEWEDVLHELGIPNNRRN